MQNHEVRCTIRTSTATRGSSGVR